MAGVEVIISLVLGNLHVIEDVKSPVHLMMLVHVFVSTHVAHRHRAGHTVLHSSKKRILCRVVHVALIDLRSNLLNKWNADRSSGFLKG